MNFKFLLLATCLTATVPASADERSPAKVAYISKVPSEIRRGAVGRKYTRFFGETVINGQRLALHFYDTQRLKTDNNGETFQKSRLDVYLETRRNNRSVYKRINSVPITYFRAEENGSKEKSIVQVEKLWLNPATLTGPTLHFKLNISFGSKPQEVGDAPFEWESGIDALFIFPQGVMGQALVQQFDAFGDPGSYMSNDFSTLDKAGFITVYRQSLSLGARGYEGWKWNGIWFVQVDKTYISVGEIGECKWDGEQIVRTIYEQH